MIGNCSSARTQTENSWRFELDRIESWIKCETEKHFPQVEVKRTDRKSPKPRELKAKTSR